MAPRKYLTVSDELVGCADATVKYFRDRGYRIKVEPENLEYPYTPTFEGTRSPIRMVIEVMPYVLEDRVQQWVRYGKSCTSDTRLVLCCPNQQNISVKLQVQLKELGVGLYLFGGEGMPEVLAPRDLAFNVELPELHSLPASVRRSLGLVYEKFERGD